MTALRIVEDHSELNGSGATPHSQLDAYVSGTFYVVLSGSVAVPPAARILTAGSGITLTDNGPGGTIVVTSTAAPPSSTVSWMEIPSGSVDGTNTTFALAHTPVPQSALMFFVNGVLQRQGPTFDYVMTGSSVGLFVPPRADANIIATYPY